MFSINSAYSRYSSQASGTVNTEIARWQILVNNENITNNETSSITINPVIEEDTNVAAGKIAPGSKGYFDIEIDPTNVDLSFKYSIYASSNENSIIKDLKITNYAITNEEEINNNSIKKVAYTENGVRGIKCYDELEKNSSFEKFIVRVFFEWDDVSTNNDLEDTQIGITAANGESVDTSINVSINFDQDFYYDDGNNNVYVCR